MAVQSLTVLTCGCTTMDLELVATAAPDRSVFRHLMPCCHGTIDESSGKIAHPVYAYIIRHDDGLVLVDTGMSETFSRDWKSNFYRDRMVYNPGEDGLFTQRLQQLDISPSDFTDVIITHLHTDHAGNLPLFAKTKARLILHEDELRGAVSVKGGMLRDDLITYWGVTSPQGFTRKDFACLLPDRATTVFGDQEIYRNLWTVSLPGHTWGSIGVALKLPHTGWVLLASDHIYFAATYGSTFIGNILVQDPVVWGQSAVKVQRLVEKYDMKVFPGHDSKIIVPTGKGKDDFTLEDVQANYQ